MQENRLRKSTIFRVNVGLQNEAVNTCFAFCVNQICIKIQIRPIPVWYKHHFESFDETLSQIPPLSLKEKLNA